MKIIKGDLFHQQRMDAVAITTNGYVNAKGLAVMGRGVAYQASQLRRDLPLILAKSLNTHGNVTRVLIYNEVQSLLSLPVKPATIIANRALPGAVVSHKRAQYKHGERVPGCFAVANVDIIERSIAQLVQITDSYHFQRVAVPLPGCGAGELPASAVLPLLHSYLDDRFYLVTL